MKLVKSHCHTDLRLYFISHRVVSRWNTLFQEIVSAISVNSFKRHLNILRQKKIWVSLWTPGPHNPIGYRLWCTYMFGDGLIWCFITGAATPGELPDEYLWLRCFQFLGGVTLMALNYSMTYFYARIYLVSGHEISRLQHGLHSTADYGSLHSRPRCNLYLRYVRWKQVPVTKSRLATVLTSDGETVVPYRSGCDCECHSGVRLLACVVYLVTFDDPWNITNMVSLDFITKYVQFIALTNAV